MKKARVEPNRKWFGNTRVVGQNELEKVCAIVHDWRLCRAIIRGVGDAKHENRSSVKS